MAEQSAATVLGTTSYPNAGDLQNKLNSSESALDDADQEKQGMEVDEEFAPAIDQ